MDSQNPEALANALEKLADNPDMRATMGQNSRALAEREFSREKLANKLAGVLQDAIAEYANK